MLCMCHMSILIHSVKTMEATMQAKNTRASGNVMYIFYTMLLSGVVMVVLYWMICRFLSRTSQSSHRERRNSSKNTSTQKKSISSAVLPYVPSKQEKSKRRTTNVRSKKKEFVHNWKIAALKGHTGHIVDISISNSGKYVGSCAEGSAREHHDERPGKQSFQKNKVGINMEGNGIIRTILRSNVWIQSFNEDEQGVYPVLYSKPVDVQVYYHSIRANPNEQKPVIGMHVPFQVSYIPLIAGVLAEHALQHNNNCLPAVSSPDNEPNCERLKIRFKDPVVAQMMMSYLIPPKFMKKYAYPRLVLDHVEIEFTPYRKISSASSSDPEGTSSTEHSDEKQVSKKSDELPTNNLRKILCVRCDKPFHIDQNNKYIDEECCFYHWGRLHKYGTDVYWSCCRKTEPCTTAKMHVWTGLVPGRNGPYTDFVCTPLPVVESSFYGVYGLDCEMCFTRNGLELTRVSLVNMCGEVVYDTLVKPKAEIIDYNSRFSGITEDNMKNVTKTLGDVQNDLLHFVNCNTILIGHGLESDLRVLRLIHSKVIDTSIMFSWDLDFPYRPSLKTMASRVLKREIQESTHNSVEDSRAAMDLVMRQLQHDISHVTNK